MKVVVILEEQPAGDIKCGLVMEGFNGATTREKAYASYFMSAIRRCARRRIAEAIGCSEIILIPGRNAEN